MIKKTIIYFVLASLIGFSFRGQASENIFISTYPSAMGKEELVETIEHTLTMRGWKIQSTYENALSAYHKFGSAHLRIKVLIVGQDIVLDGDSDKLPDIWLRNIRHDFTDALSQTKNTTSADSTDGNAPADRLKRLKDLLDNGFITQAEYDLKRKEIIDSL